MIKKIILAVILIGFICNISSGAELKDKTSPSPGFKVMTDKLVFDEKGDDFLLFCKRRFDVTAYTLIKNESGSIISFDELKVPCEAIVRYYKKPRKRSRFVAISIDVQDFPSPQPE